MTTNGDQRITACIPYYRCGRYLRRAVEGLLAQTHQNITVVVVNYGDPDSPWPFLRDVRDPRLVRFDLSGNHGPYFATAVVLNATAAPYLLIQDADDWSPPTRAAHLLDRLRRDGSDLAISAQLYYSETEAGARPFAVRWRSSTMDPRAGPSFIVRSRLTPQFLYRLPHHGLFRCDSLRRVGGYYAGFRINYDALVTNLMLMTGRISHLRQPLYYRTVRPGSLTQADDTGMQSQYRRDIINAMSGVYQNCFRFYVDYLAGRTDSRALLNGIRACITSCIPRESALQLAAESRRLRGVLARSGR